MRDFYKQELKTLNAKTGLRQFENLSSLPDGEQQITLLLDLLCKASQDFSYIPEADQKAIIQAGIYSEENFIGLNPKIIRKWLSQKAGIYFKESSHQKEADIAPPVTYDELSPETKEKVDELLRSLQSENKGFKSVPQVTQKEIDDIKIEDLEERNGKESEAVKSGYHANPELVKLHERKIAWSRECFDPLTGKPNEKWRPFE